MMGMIAMMIYIQSKKRVRENKLIDKIKCPNTQEVSK